MTDEPFQLRITVNERWKLGIEVDDQGTTYTGQATLTADESGGGDAGNWDNWGETFPDATTTGLRGDATPDLPDFNDPDTTSDVIIGEDDEVTGKTIWGRIKFAGEGRVADCIIKGPKSLPSGQTGMIDLNGKRGGLAIIEDNLFDPQFPNYRTDNVVGHQFRAYRNRMRGGQDGFGTFTKEEWAWDSQITENGIECDVEMGGNWVEWVVYSYPDGGSHSDGSHCDPWQHQGGILVKAMGNRWSGYAKPMEGSGANPDKPWLLTPPNKWANGGCNIIQDNTGAGLDATVISTLGWFEGGVSHLNGKNGTYEFSHNKHSDDVAIGPPSGMSGSKLSGYYIRLQSRASTKVINLNTNRWWKGPQEGQLLTEPRPDGIHYDS
jgi:hypothetical protein